MPSAPSHGRTAGAAHLGAAPVPVEVTGQSGRPRRGCDTIAGRAGRSAIGATTDEQGDDLGQRRGGAISWGAAALLASVAVAAVSCGGSDGEVAAGSAEAGAAVYAEKCASCHGANLEGTEKGPSHLSKVYEPSHHSDASFRRAISQGAPQHHWNFGDMPPVQGVSEDQATAVIAFIRAQQRERGFTR
jgi:mono/diheme cytochrome c family protein